MTCFLSGDDSRPAPRLLARPSPFRCAPRTSSLAPRRSRSRAAESEGSPPARTARLRELELRADSGARRGRAGSSLWRSGLLRGPVNLRVHHDVAFAVCARAPRTRGAAEEHALNLVPARLDVVFHVARSPAAQKHRLGSPGRERRPFSISPASREDAWVEPTNVRNVEASLVVPRGPYELKSIVEHQRIDDDVAEPSHDLVSPVLV